jgi:hypothetical protein
MASGRRRKHAEGEAPGEADLSFNPAEFETPADGPPKEAEPAAAPQPEQPPAHGQHTGHASKARPKAPRLPDTCIRSAGDLLVQLIDKGDNAAGIGIRVLAPEGRSLTGEEKGIIRAHVRGDGGTGFDWKQGLGMWHKPVGADAPAMKAVAIRLDAERRVAALAADLAEHHRDPQGFAARVRQGREQAAETDRIPD